MRRTRVFSVMVAVLLMAGLVASLPRVFSGTAHAASIDDLTREVVQLTNAERAKQSLPPLKLQDNLKTAATWLSQDMADNNYFDHTDRLGRAFNTRLVAFGYTPYSTIGENISAGYGSPSAAVAGWMGSAGHKANILNAGYCEIGAGYGSNSGSQYGDYWTQDFGCRPGVSPVIINNEASETSNSSVNLYIYGAGWAQQMRLSNDGATWTSWQPYQSGMSWMLAAGSGTRAVHVELKNGSTIRSSSDSIQVTGTTPAPTPTSTPPTPSTITPVPSPSPDPGTPTPASAAASLNAVAGPGARAYLPFTPKGWNGWTATIAVQNAGDAPTSTVLRFYDEGGEQVAAHTLPNLAPGGATRVDLASVPALPVGFAGSTVAVSDGGGRVVASVDLHKDAMDLAAYEGLTGGGTTLYAPLLFKNYSGWNTFLSVQNLGSAPAPVTVTYRHRDSGETWAQSFTLKPSTPRLLDQAGSALLPDGFVGSAVLTSGGGQPLALIVHEEKGAWAMDYTGMSAGNPTLSAPLLFKNFHGYNSGWQMQNLGNLATTVTVTYRHRDSGQTWTASANVGPGASYSFEQYKDGQLPDDAVFSGLATSSNGQPLAGLVNELQYSRNQVMNYVAPGTGADTVYVPLMMKGVDSWRTGVQVQNLEDAPAPVVVQFLNPDATLRHSISETIPAGGSLSYDLGNIAQVPTGWVGSVRVVSSEGQLIAAIANEVR